MHESIGILGAGGHARELASYSEYAITFFAVEKEYIKRGLIDITKPNKEQLQTPVACALGAPGIRHKFIKLWAGTKYANIIASNSYIDNSTILGTGIQVAPYAVVTNGCSIGDHVIINTAATISHDCIIGNFATISPGAHIGGGVHISDGSFIGIGATVINNLFIAEGVTIGAGAVVLNDANVKYGVYVGNPAKLLRIGTGWLNEV